MRTRTNYFLLVCCLIPHALAVFNFRRLTGGGDFETINRIAEDLKLTLNLTIEPKEVSTQLVDGVSITTIEALATIGNEGECRDLRINEGGDLTVTGEFVDDEQVIGFIRPLEVYEITVEVTNLQFTCEIPLDVDLITAGFLNSGSGGSLTFSSTEAVVTQKIKLFSTDFSRFPPVVAEPGSCIADPVELTYVGEDLLEVATFDFSSIVVDALEADEELVFGEVQGELCKLGDTLALEISSIAVNNLIVNESSSFYIESPFVADENGELPAIRSETNLLENLDNSTNRSILDFTDRDNFFVELIVPENPDDVSIITQVLDFLTDPEGVSEIDSIILFLEQSFGVTVEEDGSILEFDTITIFDGTFFDPELEPEDVDFVFKFNYTLDDIFLAEANIEIQALFLSVFPPQSEVEGEANPPILPAFQVLEGANHSLFLEGINLNDIIVTASFTVDVLLENAGTDDEDLFFLANAFTETFSEIVDITIDWKGFVASFGLLMAFDLDVFTQLELGPLVEFIFECGLSAFVITPRVTGATVDHEAVDVSVSQLTNAISVLVADLIEVLVPAYQVALPRGLELLISETLTDQQLLNETECPTTDIAFDNVDLFPFDLTEGIIKNISDAIDADLANQLFDQADLGEFELVIFGAEPVQGEGLGFGLIMPEDENEESQNISIRIERMTITGLLPTKVNELSVLKPEPTDEFPEIVRSIFDFADADLPAKLNILIGVNGTDPGAFRDEFNFTLHFDRVVLLIDLYLKFSEYDVNSTKVVDVPEYMCWVSRLNSPGGVKDLRFVGNGIQITGRCLCDNPIVQAVADSVLDPEQWPAFFEEFEDLVNRLGDLLVHLFSTEIFSETIATSDLVCETDNFSKIGVPSFPAEPTSSDFEVVLPMFAFFAFAVITPGVVACLITKISPRGATRRDQNAEYNKKLASDVVENESEEELLNNLHITNPLWKNPIIPKVTRYIIPIIFMINFALFVVGDAGYLMSFSVFGDVIGLPYNNENITFLSIFSVVSGLFLNGAEAYAIILFVLAVLWPYLRLVILLFCWFISPSKVSVTRRGQVITILDVLGRFTFIEFYFILFILVIFNVSPVPPAISVLPEEAAIFNLSLDIKPLYPLFVYAIAVILSIVLSNTILVYQHNIENETRIRLRQAKLKKIMNKRNDATLLYDPEARDKKEFKVSNWNFSVYEKDEEGNVLHQYTYSITKAAVLFCAFLVVAASATLIFASVIGSVKIQYTGFFRYFLEEPDFELSVVEILLRINRTYNTNVFVQFVSVLFIMTITVIPLVRTGLLLVLMFTPLTVKAGRRLTEAHHIISVWACIDVFILTLTLTVVSLPNIMGGVVGTLSFCEPITGAVTTIFTPMGYMTEEDARRGCAGTKGEITRGGFIAVLAVLVLSLANLLVSRIFYFYIADREKVVQITNTGDNLTGPESTIKSFHLKLARYGLITIDVRGLKRNIDDNGIPTHLGPKRPAATLSEWIKEKRSVVGSQSVNHTIATRRPQRPANSVVTMARTQLPGSNTTVVSKRPKRPAASVVSMARTAVEKPTIDGDSVHF